MKYFVIICSQLIGWCLVSQMLIGCSPKKSSEKFLFQKIEKIFPYAVSKLGPQIQQGGDYIQLIIDQPPMVFDSSSILAIRALNLSKKTVETWLESRELGFLQDVTFFREDLYLLTKKGKTVSIWRFHPATKELLSLATGEEMTGQSWSKMEPVLCLKLGRQQVWVLNAGQNPTIFHLPASVGEFPAQFFCRQNDLVIVKNGELLAFDYQKFHQKRLLSTTKCPALYPLLRAGQMYAICGGKKPKKLAITNIVKDGIRGNHEVEVQEIPMVENDKYLVIMDQANLIPANNEQKVFFRMESDAHLQDLNVPVSIYHRGVDQLFQFANWTFVAKSNELFWIDSNGKRNKAYFPFMIHQILSFDGVLLRFLTNDGNIMEQSFVDHQISQPVVAPHYEQVISSAHTDPEHGVSFLASDGKQDQYVVRIKSNIRTIHQHLSLVGDLADHLWDTEGNLVLAQVNNINQQLIVSKTNSEQVVELGFYGKRRPYLQLDSNGNYLVSNGQMIISLDPKTLEVNYKVPINGFSAGKLLPVMEKKKFIGIGNNQIFLFNAIEGKVQTILPLFPPFPPAVKDFVLTGNQLYVATGTADLYVGTMPEMN